MLKRELINADDAHLFWVHNNDSLRNLKDLVKSLRTMEDETFAYHLNPEKNDFANWVEQILQDKKLANDLRRVKTRLTAAKKVEARLKRYYNV